MAEPPVVSVVIATYRRPHYLREAIESVLKQDYQDWRIVVHDDGETFENLDVVDGFADARIVHRVNPHRVGIGANKFSGWRAATGRYLANLDDDDLWEPHFLSTLVPILEADPSLVIAFGSHAIIDAHGVVDGAATASNEAVTAEAGRGSPRVARAARPGRPSDTANYGLAYPPRADRLDELSAGHGCRGRLLARLPRRTQRRSRVLRASEPDALPSARRVGHGRRRYRLAPVVCRLLPAAAARPAAPAIVARVPLATACLRAPYRDLSDQIRRGAGCSQVMPPIACRCRDPCDARRVGDVTLRTGGPPRDGTPALSRRLRLLAGNVLTFPNSVELVVLRGG